MIRTRFAPSPTGYMHIGNLRTALYEYLIARHYNGKFILRIEDTDQSRQVEGAVDIIFNTLKTAGLQYDEGPDIGGDFGPYTQSERLDIYKKFAEELVSKGKAYYCFCKNKDRRSHDQSAHEKYGRTCYRLKPDEIKLKLNAGETYVIRQLIPEGETRFLDLVYGDITINNDELEDQILIKSDGMPTYNFANVIDDHLMEITHVLRGSEYLSSTPKYNLLYEAFCWRIPVYIHLPLIMNEQGEKLSKRKGHGSFEDLLAMGFLPQAVINYIALLGWSPADNQEIFSLDELAERFDENRLNKAPSVFDITKLTWMNAQYFANMNPDDFKDLALPVLSDSIKTVGVDLELVAGMVQPRISFLREIPGLVDFIDALPEYTSDLYIHKKMKTNLENSMESLKFAETALSKLEEWSTESTHNVLVSLVKQLGIKNGQMLWPIRTALSGKPTSPCGAAELCGLLGKEESLRRIRKGIQLF
ncbi:MAG: glutamate--tRNA ligase [Clostridiales bacterium]|jgi:glutamyl-tRNA synthetase|nr:glutamate--tRNA ligase [Clostridiales bacterium]